MAVAVAVARPRPGEITIKKCPEYRNGLVRYHRLFDQGFGSVLEPTESVSLAQIVRQDVPYMGPKAVSTVVSFPVQFERPQPHCSGVSEIYCDALSYYIRLNVLNFGPEDLEVKAVHKERHIVVHGRHARRDDEHGDIIREFTRHYVVPENVDLGKLRCEYRDRCTLFFEAPKLPFDGALPERPILIHLENRGCGQQNQQQQSPPPPVAQDSPQPCVEMPTKAKTPDNSPIRGSGDSTSKAGDLSPDKER